MKHRYYCNDIKRTYLTLDDLVFEVFDQGDDRDNLLLGIPFITKSGSTVTNTFLNKIVHQYFEDTNFSNLDELVNTMLCTYFYPKYHNYCITYIDGEVEESDIEEKFRQFISKLVAAINSTSGEFEKLIELYSSIELNLLDNVRSISRYQDTPQVVTTIESQYVLDEKYNSSVTINESEISSKISRLHEVETLIRDYYELWMNEVARKAGVFLND